MRQFFKFMFASMIGTFLVGVLLVFIFIGMVAAAISSGLNSTGNTANIKDGTVLHLMLDKEIVDRGEKDPFEIDLGPFQAEARIGLNTLLNSLENAKTDDHIEGVFLDLTSLQTGFATIKEIREKVLEFKAVSGKPVIAYSEMYSQGAYYLATAADAVYLQPKGELAFMGLRSEYMFFDGLFKKLDIDIQFIRGTNNKFKSFGEMYTQDHMSEANKEQNRALLSGIWNEYLTAISDSRKLDKARLNVIADSLEVRNADDALALGMIDGIKFRDEVLDILKDKMALDKEKAIEFVQLRKYAKTFTPSFSLKNDGSSNGKLAVIYAEGGISSGESSEGTIGSTSLAETIREAREDTTIKAIVFRVNSPGGSGLASDVIWREVELATKVKPVIVSMGDVAASGGYYISAPATRIFAEPNTITGSIGVFGIIPNMQGFFNNKTGITFDGTKTHKFADMMTITRPLTEEEKGIIQGYVDDFYTTFKERVAEGRKMTVDQVDSIGQGRVWTGIDAKERGLVDELGGLEDAIKAAADIAGLTNYSTVELPVQKDLFEQLLEDLSGQTKAWVASEVMGEDLELLGQFKRASEVRKQMGIQARMEFDLNIR
ncbi:MAG: signal peptide peptidase SppA [Flavobacteriales bacterium]|nr:signal peptide peptidase SppA [Flavobacteriales bacterium]MBK6946558.1 signal peptide peptidase SppA [Flavobacteriales bacterium]MBK7239703.1 signal peptide peptidase SppA [Flavobacteriales bacterium]MBK9536609.1 signal peptide peptidase SppA [Flavobacteriales bacterium]MBP9138400.1 signal peptide peptidase SppA [Flavobacteriales bacterium]